MSFFEILKLVGSLGFFIYGMKIMSEGVQKVAGDKLRNFLTVMTQNRFMGVFTGMSITLLIQSSSATTVMVVSFVNAGLLSLVQAVGVIMGANIGTTVTAWLVSYIGFKVQISSLSLPIIAIAFPLMFSSKSTLKAWAEFMIGFALLFMGLDFLKASLPDLKTHPEALSFIKNFSGHGLKYLFLSIVMGTILTLVVQSSSAAIALTLTMCYEGWIPFEMAAGIVLGENIGTTITANLAALIANVHSKRAAFSHFVFNVFGVCWIILIFPYFIQWIDMGVIYMEGKSALTGDNHATIPIALSLFHSVFNILNVLLLVWFVPQIAHVCEKLIPSRGEEDEEFKLEFIETGILGTVELSLHEVRKELVKFGGIIRKMSSACQTLLLKSKDNPKMQAKLLSRIQKLEDITDRMEIAIAEFLAKVSEGDLAEGTSVRIQRMLSIINDLERVGDIYYQISKSLEKKIQDNIYYTPEKRAKMVQMFETVDEALKIMMKNLDSDYKLVKISSAFEKEQEINNLRNVLNQEHLLELEKGEFGYSFGIIYKDIISSLEKVGDHVMNVSEAITGEKPKLG